MGWVEGASVAIDRPVEDVWAFMVDFSNMPRWEDSGAVWTQLSEAPLQVGTLIRSSIRALGRTAAFELRVATFDPPRTFSVESTAGMTKGTKIAYRLVPIDGRTTGVSRMTDARFRGIAKLLQPVAGIVTRGTGRLELRNLKRLLENQG